MTTRRPSPHRTDKGRKKPLLSPGVTHVDYKDVTLLRTFISDRKVER